VEVGGGSWGCPNRPGSIVVGVILPLFSSSDAARTHVAAAAVRAFLPAEGTGVSRFPTPHKAPNAPRTSTTGENKSLSPLQSPRRKGGTAPRRSRGRQCYNPGNRPGASTPSRGGDAAAATGAFLAWGARRDGLDDKNGLQQPENQWQ